MRSISPYPCDLVMVPFDPSVIAGDAAVGAVPPDRPQQIGELFPERTMQVEPTPFDHGRQCSWITIFCRYLTDKILECSHTCVKPREAETRVSGASNGTRGSSSKSFSASAVVMMPSK